MSWGSWGKRLSGKEQTELIQFCTDNGNITFDHADIYGDYTTEEEFGKAFKNSGIPRESVQLISKCGIQLIGNSRNITVKHYNYSKEYIIWSAEQSLRKLKTDYLDTFLLHRPSPLMHPDEIAEAVSALKESGKINQFGVSNFLPSQMELLSTKTNISVNQIEYSLSQAKAMQDGTLDYMFKNCIQPMCWSPLGKVFKEDNAQSKRVKNRLDQLTKKYDVSEETLLLSWILRHPAAISPVIGTTSKQPVNNGL